MQIRTFDVERLKPHEFDDLSRSAYKFAQRNSYVISKLITYASYGVDSASIVRFGALSHIEKRCGLRGTFSQVTTDVFNFKLFWVQNVVQISENNITECLHNMEQLLEDSELMRIGFF